jgi:hypothetical protein
LSGGPTTGPDNEKGEDHQQLRTFDSDRQALTDGYPVADREPLAGRQSAADG